MVNVGFAAGEPDFETPAPIREAMKEAMDLGTCDPLHAGGGTLGCAGHAARLEADHGLIYGMDEIIVSNAPSTRSITPSRPFWTRATR